MASTEFVDPYLDPETGLFRNKVGARTKVALDEAEGDLVFARLIQLLDHPVKPTGGLDELCAIHRHLFQDIYDWAGRVRTVDIRKNLEGAHFFLPVSMIGRASMFAEGELRADNHLLGMDRARFIERLAYHYDVFNYIHPFREGNGRTQRVFWNRIARDAGWQLDWSAVDGPTNDRASRAASDDQDLGPLREMLDKVVSRVTPPDERDAAWRTMERTRLSFPSKAAPTAPAPRGGLQNPPEGRSSAPRSGRSSEGRNTQEDCP